MIAATKSARAKSPFATAKAVEPKAKGTTITIVDPRINRLHRLSVLVARLEAKIDECKAALREVGDDRVLPQWAQEGVLPASPIKLVDSIDGASVTFIVQDRTTSTAASESAIEALADALDLKSDAAGLAVESEIFAFNADVLGMRVRDRTTGRKTTVQSLVGTCIAGLLSDLVADEELTPQQAGSLLTVTRVKKWAPGLLEKIGKLAAGDVMRLRSAVSALGSAVVRYVKPA